MNVKDEENHDRALNYAARALADQKAEEAIAQESRKITRPYHMQAMVLKKRVLCPPPVLSLWRRWTEDDRRILAVMSKFMLLEFSCMSSWVLMLILSTN